MDLNIQIDAGGVTGDLPSAASALERIKRLVESTEPLGTHLAKGSKTEIDSLLVQMRRLATSIEGDMGRVERAMKDATPKDMRAELERTLVPMRQMVQLMDQLRTMKFEGLGGVRAAAKITEIAGAVKDLTGEYGKLTLATAAAGKAAETNAVAAAAASRAATAALDKQISDAQARVAAFIKNHPAGDLSTYKSPYSTSSSGSSSSSSAALAAASTAATQSASAAALANANANTTAATAAAKHAASVTLLNQLLGQYTGSAGTGTAATGSLTQAFNTHLVSANNLHSAYRGLASGFGAMWLTWGNVLPLLAGAAVSHAVTSVVKTGVELDHTLTTISALGEVAAGDLEKLSAKALELGRTSTYGPGQVTEALKALSLAGLNATEQLSALPAVLNFAKVGDVKLEQAAEGLVAVGTAYGYQANELTIVSDVVAKTAASSMANVTDMTQAFRQSTTVAMQYGVSLQDTATALAVLSQAGIRGSAAGTAFRQMYNELMGSSKKARAALEELGISIFDNVTNKVKPLATILQDVSGALQGMNFEGVMRTLQAIGNERGLKSLSANLQAIAVEAQKSGQDVTSVFAKLASEISNSAGFSAQAAAEMATSTKSIMEGVSASLETTLASAFKQVQPEVNEFFRTLRDAINADGVKDGIAEIARGVLGLATSVVSAAGAVSSLIAPVVKLVEVFGGLFALLVAGAAAATAYSKVMAGVEVLKALLVTRATALAAAQAGVNGAMLAAAPASAAMAGGLRLVLGAALPLTAAIAAAYGAFLLLQQVMGRGTGSKAVKDLEEYKKALAASTEDNLRQVKAMEEGLTSSEAQNKITGDKLLQSVLDEKREELVKVEKLATFWQQKAETARAEGDKATAERTLESVLRRKSAIEASIESEKQSLKDLQNDNRMSAQQRQNKDQAQYESRMAKMRAQIATPGGSGSVAGSGSGAGSSGNTKNYLADETKQLQAEEAKVQALEEEIAKRKEMQGLYTGMTDAEKTLYDIDKKLNSSTVDGVRALTEWERALLLKTRAQVAHRVELEKEVKPLREADQAGQQLTQSLVSQAEQLEAANASYGKGKVAIGEMNLATMEAAQQMGAAALIGGKYVTVTDAMIEGQKRLNEAQRQANIKKLNQEMEDYVRTAQDALAVQQSTFSTLGMLSGDRELYLKKLQIEQETQKKLLDIERQRVEVGNEATDKALAQAKYVGELKKQMAEIEPILERIKSALNSFQSSLTDAFVDGIMEGKLQLSSFRSAFKQLARQLLVEPLVMNLVINPIMSLTGNLLTGIFGGLFGGSGGTSLTSLFSGASNLWSAGSNIWSLITGGFDNLLTSWGSSLGGMWGTLTGTTAANTAIGTSLGLSTAEATAASTAAAQAGGTTALTGSLAGAGVVAVPLIVGYLAERNRRERISGAGYATSDYTNDPYVTASGTSYDPIGGTMPSHDALVEAARQAGMSESDLARFGTSNDRALYQWVRSAGATPNNDSGYNAGQNIDGLLSGKYASNFYQGQGYTHPQAMGWWNDKGYNLASNDPNATALSRTVAISIVDPLRTIGKMLGDTESDLRVTVGYATRGAGNGVWAGMNITRNGKELTNWTNFDDYHSVDEALRGMYSQALNVLSTTFDLPKWAQDQADKARTEMDALEGDDLGQQAATLWQTTTTNIAKTYASIKELIDVFPDFADATQDSVYALSELMGGMDSMQSSYSSYLQHYWTEEERANLAKEQLVHQFKQLGIEMPTSLEGFRKLVEGLDLNTEAGRAMFAQLMSLEGAFYDLESTTGSLASATFQASSDLADVIQQGLLGKLSAADVGGQMADIVVGGIYDAIANGFATQITKIMMDGVITPMLQAAVAGTSITEAVSEATIQAMIEQATAVAEALGQILNSSAFQEAMRQVESAMYSLAPRITAPTPYYTTYESRQNAAEKAAEEAARAAEKAADDAARAAEEAARQLQEIAKERLGLLQQLLEKEGNTTELRAIELLGLDESNRALQERIWALEDALEAEKAYTDSLAEAQEFLKSFSTSIDKFILDTRMDQTDSSVGYSLAAAQYNQQLALARSGDRTALGDITSYASTLIEAAKENATTQAEADLAVGRILGQLGELPRTLTAEELIVEAVEDMKNTLSGVLITSFDTLDTTADGLLTKDELLASGLASSTQIAALIARVDTNGDGMISKAEAIRAQTLLNTTAAQATATAVSGTTSAVNSTTTAVSTGTTTTSTSLGVLSTKADTANTISDNIKNNTFWMSNIAANTWNTADVLFRVIAGNDVFVVTSRNQTGGYMRFALGGAFTNGIVNSPTMFSMGLMGEAGPEAIMPLTRTSTGHLGVRAVGGENGSVDAPLLMAVIEAIERLRADQRSAAGAVVSQTKRAADFAEKSYRLSQEWDVEGTPAPRETVEVEMAN